MSGIYEQVLTEPKPRKKVAVAFWNDARNVSKSSNAIARLLHSESSRRWTESADTELVEAFEAAEKLSTSGYQLGTRKDREKILQAVAIKTNRSPRACQIRLGALGVDLTRKKVVPAKDVRKFITAGIKSIKV